MMNDLTKYGALENGILRVMNNRTNHINGINNYINNYIALRILNKYINQASGICSDPNKDFMYIKTHDSESRGQKKQAVRDE